MMGLEMAFDVVIAVVFFAAAWYTLNLSRKAGAFKLARAWIMFSSFAILMAIHYLLELFKYKSDVQAWMTPATGALWLVSASVEMVAAVCLALSLWMLASSFMIVEER